MRYDRAKLGQMDHEMLPWAALGIGLVPFGAL